MSLDKISKESKLIEDSIQLQINSNINNYASFIFDSGAGAGKTYALIESLKYIVFKYNNILTKNNQKIICITYTNVATEEVKKRLGNSSLILVSTIHERIWSLIKDYQKELVKIHYNNIKNQLLSSKKELKDLPLYKESIADISKIKKIAIENKEYFYKFNNDSASVFRDKFCSKFGELINIRNISNLKKLVSLIYKIERFEKCLIHINSNDAGYTKVSYDSRNNLDRLDKMRFSHDTLLEYGYEIINQYPILQQIIIDKYPFILIDEYQDTNENVVKIMAILDKFAKKKSKKLLIGYFGDVSQNIYDSGIGRRLPEIHKNLEIITKKFNRRSTLEIINVINKIRSDNLSQESIYTDSTGGTVNFNEILESKIDLEIEKIIDKWEITEKNKLHCLVLTNRLLAEYCKFPTIYDCFKSSKYYKINFKQLNSELLSNDILKLGEIPLFLFKIFNFLQNINENSTSIISLINDNIPSDKYLEIIDLLTLTKIKEFVQTTRKINGTSLHAILESIEKEYNQNNEIFKMVIESIFDMPIFKAKIFEDRIFDSLYFELENEENIKNAKNNILRLLDIKIEEYHRWFNFIKRKQDGKIEYHTYHGTKGLQFTNEIIIMENRFGKIRDYFNFYFENLDKTELLNGEDLTKFTSIQNLLYVACSRAIYNLDILYLDDISSFKDNIVHIFGEINDSQ